MYELPKNSVSKALWELRKERILVGMDKGSFHETLFRLRTVE